MNFRRQIGVGIFAAAVVLGQDSLNDDALGSVSGDNCTFLAAPDAFLNHDLRSRQLIQARLLSLDAGKPSRQAAVVPAITLPRRNFIDDEIFDRLLQEKVAPGALSSDEDFFRRASLDISGRIPSPADVRTFVADKDLNKRSATIQKLLLSDGYVDKWVMWLGDLTENNATAVNFNRQINGRNAFYRFLWAALLGDDSLKDTTYKILTATGNNYDDFNPSGWLLNGNAPGGPIQDTYDMELYKAAKQFLGLGHYDCLLCHNGRGHLDAISSWGKYATRADAEGMAAFFSRSQFPAYVAATGTSIDVVTFYANSRIVGDNNTGSYALPTTYGNRPNRLVVNNQRTVPPVYRDGQKPGSNNWRAEFAKFLVNDPLFSINIVNRVWKEMFGLGLVDSVDALDPDRLDPNVKLDAGWDYQATHPQLLIKLAADFRAKNYNLRELVRTIAESSAYQLSSRYDGDWNLTYVPLFARHYPRRLMGEEVHDAIAKATGVFTKYTVQGLPGDPVQWAMQMPDTSEPRGNGTSLNFMNLFLRGNRDTVSRSQGSTILQSLAMMNDPFVNGRFHTAQSPALQAIAKLTTPAAQLDELYLTFLGRLPSDFERTKGLAFLTPATTTAAKNAAIEDLAWALMNKLEFQFSY